MRFSRRFKILLSVTNRVAILAAKDRAEALGYHTVVLSSSIEGEARRVAIDHMMMAKKMYYRTSTGLRRAGLHYFRAARDNCYTPGQWDGRSEPGIRACCSYRKLNGVEGVVALSGGTDGTGWTDGCGWRDRRRDYSSACERRAGGSRQEITSRETILILFSKTVGDFADHRTDTDERHGPSLDSSSGKGRFGVFLTFRFFSPLIVACHLNQTRFSLLRWLIFAIHP